MVMKERTTMQTRKRSKRALPIDRQRLAEAYRQVVASIREARSVQSVLEKERQMRRLMHYLHLPNQAKS
jgi:hypothetical protein